MTTKEEFVEEVRSWIDTPFHHGARVKGAGCDCVGLVVGACNNLGLPVTDLRAYPKQPIDGLFEKYVDSQTIEVQPDDIQLGDLLKFRFKDEQQHLAVVTQIEPCVRITHSFSAPKKCVETDYDEIWQKRLAGIRRLPVLNNG
jgi:cell wall-associated NlpC family hydrolase